MVWWGDNPPKRIQLVTELSQNASGEAVLEASCEAKWSEILASCEARLETKLSLIPRQGDLWI